ncbi:DUF3899 domain-containing protein [Oceanobacillus salinisoli]|uniref:DUF3899 domain-containing protein n=1 Tax=Oceanobacillus salinisoli TaxID=2678611 RepID=UPI0012E1630A|nr:DUF3899 domain-containing protein [Oceanobacillus salinisoli]
MKKNKGFYLIINLIVIILIYVIFSTGYNIVNLINTFFYISFFYLIITLFLYTKRGGFYDGITFSFRRFASIMSRNKDYLEEWKEKPLPSEKRNDTFYHIVKFQAIVFLIIFVLLLLLYYM